MAKRKIINVKCYGPIAAGPHYESPWEDVWLQWKGKPGRRKYSADPTLVGLHEALNDLKVAPAKDKPDQREVLKQLKRQPYVVEITNLTHVYTRAEQFNRAEAERMLAYYLKERHGIANPKFRWRKSTFRLMPATFSIP